MCVGLELYWLSQCDLVPMHRSSLMGKMPLQVGPPLLPLKFGVTWRAAQAGLPAASEVPDPLRGSISIPLSRAALNANKRMSQKSQFAAVWGEKKKQTLNL